MTLNQHEVEETLEALVMGRLPPAETERVEDHLLVCEKCRIQFEEIESFVLAAKTASARIVEREKTRPAPAMWQRVLFPLTAHPVWAGVGACGLAALLALPMLRERPLVSRDLPYREITLTTMRGNERAAASGSETLLRLKLDLRELPPLQIVRVIVVDATGGKKFETEVSATQAVSPGVAIPQRLARGLYWVRLMEPGEGGKLLREYPLRVD